MWIHDIAGFLPPPPPREKSLTGEELDLAKGGEAREAGAALRSTWNADPAEFHNDRLGEARAKACLQWCQASP